MAKTRKFSFNVASIGDGSGTGYSPYISGYIESIQYVKVDYVDGVDFAITAAATGEPIWAESNVNAAVTKYPRAATHSVLGAASLYVAGAAVLDRIALDRDRVKVVLAQAGATKTGTFVVTISES